jgi:hypothetical protein
MIVHFCVEVFCSWNKHLKIYLTARNVDNIKMGLQEVGCGDMDWIDLA